jgi:glutaredoxin
MKRLILRDDIYYTSDSENIKKGKTNILKYVASKNNMPHHFFKKYIVIYGRTTCPYCIKMIDYVKHNPKALFVEIDANPLELFEKSNLLKILSTEIGNHSTVPIIFNKTVFVGGLEEYENNIK